MFLSVSIQIRANASTPWHAELDVVKSTYTELFAKQAAAPGFVQTWTQMSDDGKTRVVTSVWEDKASADAYVNSVSLERSNIVKLSESYNRSNGITTGRSLLTVPNPT